MACVGRHMRLLDDNSTAVILSLSTLAILACYSIVLVSPNGLRKFFFHPPTEGAKTGILYEGLPVA